MTQATLATNAILFPPGRIVQGDVYEAQTTDLQGNPLTIKTGQNAGKPRVNYFFALAVAKTRALWWEEVWGAQILALAVGFWPQGQTSQPKFSWKIEDGDTHVNENGRRNADREGHPGHWIIKFGSSFPTKIFDAQGNPMLQPGLVKCGFWVEVLGSIATNENTQKPGIYINHNMVAFRAPDKEILKGVDPRAVGFGRAALPAGVTAAPVGTANMPAMPPQPAAPGAPVPYTPPAPAAAAPVPYTPPAAAPVPVPGAPVAVAPNPGFIAPPGAAPGVAVPPGGTYPPVSAPVPYTPPAPAAVAPMPPAAPAPAYPDPLGAPAGYRMANPAGARYEGYRAQGWTDAQLLQGGHMVKL